MNVSVGLLGYPRDGSTAEVEFVVSSSGVCKVGTSSASRTVYSTIVAGVACNNRNGVGILRTNVILQPDAEELRRWMAVVF